MTRLDTQIVNIISLGRTPHWISRPLSIIRSAILVLIAGLIIAGTAFAQEERVLDVSDLAGDWRIEVVDRPNDDFKGTAHIPYGKGDTIMAETITEDKCCGGKNHARVLQNSRITISDGQIVVESEIVKFLLREEEVDIRYSADDFELTWLDHNTLIGRANGYTPVRWVRDQRDVS